MEKRRTVLIFLLIPLLLTVIPVLKAEEGAVCEECVQIADLKGTSVPLVLRYQNDARGGYVANGTCMRNFGYGTIVIGGVPAGSVPVKAFLYWEILNVTEGASFRNCAFEGTAITGVAIASAIGDPCWIVPEGTGRAWVYMAEVTPLLKPGINGVYLVSNFATGVTNGTLPWPPVALAAPFLEGASLVIVYENAGLPFKTVQVYDGGVTFVGMRVETILSGFQAGLPPNAVTTFIVGDGQQAGLKNATWNGNRVVVDTFDGRDVVDSTGIRNLTKGWLWDTLTVPVNMIPGSTSAIADIESTTDCLTWVAQVFQVDALDPYVGGTLMPNVTVAVAVFAVAGVAAASMMMLSYRFAKKHRV